MTPTEHVPTEHVLPELLICGTLISGTICLWQLFKGGNDVSSQCKQW